MAIDFGWKSSPNMSKATGFLDLAYELREQVYIEHFDVETSQFIQFGLTDDGKAYITNHLRRTALLRTCKQIRFEASPFFYSQNRFEIYPRTTLRGSPKFPIFSSPLTHFRLRLADFEKHGCIYHDLTYVWRYLVNDANRIYVIFPTLRKLELVVRYDNQEKYIWHTWSDVLYRPAHVSKEEQAKRVEKWIMAVRKLDNAKLPTCAQILFTMVTELRFGHDLEAFQEGLARSHKRGLGKRLR